MADRRDRGWIVEGWSPPERPGPVEMQGRYARLERLDPARHGGDLYRAKRGADAIWDYLPYGPFERESDYRAWAEGVARGTDPVFYAIQDLESGQWSGVASYLRIAPESGSIEVGHINLAPELQRSRAATEAMYLMMSWAFAAGYRRYEW
ncbi:GNAT family N-acetyltransferase, partial [Thioclava sp. BHET1]